ncbi:MAG: hypothetical protein ABFR32_05335 [Bacteroidota bacterium]
MKKIHFIAVIIGFVFFNMNSVNAQKVEKSNEIVYKTTVKETPQKVKEALKDYSGYKISQKATYTKNSKGKMYKFKVEKGNWSHYLLIDESGKIVAIETGEHKSS